MKDFRIFGLFENPQKSAICFLSLRSSHRNHFTLKGKVDHHHGNFTTIFFCIACIDSSHDAIKSF